MNPNAGSPQFYVLSPAPWPPDTASVTWSFATRSLDYSDSNRQDLFSGITVGFTPAQQQAIRDATAAWEAVCGVNFVEVSDGSSVDVRIGWENWTTSDGDGGAFVGAQSWYSPHSGFRSEVAGYFDPAENWDGVSLYDSALYIFGSALGIQNSDIPGAVVSSTDSYQPGRDQLTNDDIAAARALWGPPDSVGETLIGSAGDDWLSGSAGNDRLWGLDGNDTLWGGDGVDTLFGMNGNDNIDGDYGRDILLGGAGDDFIVGDFGASDDGTSDAAFGDGDDAIWGESGNDTLWGEGGADFLAGGTGNDSLYGAGGRDYLAGESGNDRLVGGSGYDIVAGGAGSDTLVGGAEGDTFFGQAGADRFEYNGGTLWLMDLEADDVLDFANGARVVGLIQLGWHARIDMSDGGTVYAAWTDVDDLWFA